MLRRALRRGALVRAARVSAFVGTVLNLINNGPRLYAEHVVSWPHVALNYFVPFCVASYSAAANGARDDISPRP